MSPGQSAAPQLRNLPFIMSNPSNASTLDTISALCKRRGFIFPSSEIYGGINGFWDYGPLGSELKRNIRDAWWRATVRGREDVVGLDATIIMNPAIWRASGHADTFSDPMVDCRDCKKRHRADQLCEEQGKKLVVDPVTHAMSLPEGVVCTECGSKNLTEPKSFNLMFKTYVGPVEDASSQTWLRPETAQAIFAQFVNVTGSTRVQVPFGIAQQGKSFRNEITPRNYTFRSREFEQMELEFFIKPDEAIELVCGHVATMADNPDLDGDPQPDWGWEVWHRYWFHQRLEWYRTVGIPVEKLHQHWQTKEELAHYARACVDLEFEFPFGVQELEGIAARSDFDLSQHQKHSGKSQEVFDEALKNAVAALTPEAKEAFVAKTVADWTSRGKTEEAARAFLDELFEGRYIPHVIEPSAGTDRMALAMLCNAYEEQKLSDAKGKEDVRTVLHFHPSIAPVKVAVFPLVKNRPELYAKAREVFKSLRNRWNCFWDESGAIGRRYRRQDEVGTPFCVTVDFDTLEKGTVTVRDRDTMEQTSMPLDQLVGYLSAKIDGV